MPNVSGSSERIPETLGPKPPDRPEFSLRDIFLGRDGLRAIWGVLLFLFLRWALFACVYPLFEALSPRSAGVVAFSRPRPVLVYEGLALFCVILATWAMAKIEGRPVSVYGFYRRRRLGNFALGMGSGLAMLSLLVFALRATGHLVFDGRALSGWMAFHYGVEWLAGFLFVGLLEECLFRGYLQFTLTRGLSSICGWFHLPRRDALGFWTAAIILSFGFGFGHKTNAGESPIGLLAAGVIGIVFCLSLWRTGSLWWAIGFHAAWDWAQSFVYGVADSGLIVQGRLFATHPVGRPILSGGLTGPEGSLFILPIAALTAVVIVLTLPRAPFRYAPDVVRRDASEDPRQPQLHLDLQ